jgi:secreted trypsin-like serine protease
MNLVSLADASQVYLGLSQAHLAAGVPGGGRDTCQGDSGGPLVVSDGRGGWCHAGTVSFGDGCGRDGTPGIYGNTINYRSWILQQIETSVPVATDDHGNTAATATAVAWNAPTRGVLETTSDQDWFRLEASGSVTLNLVSSGTNDVQGTLINLMMVVNLKDFTLLLFFLVVTFGAPKCSFSKRLSIAKKLSFPSKIRPLNFSIREIERTQSKVKET